MMRFDERYDEFGYERDDDDYEEEINEFLTPREVMELLAIGGKTGVGGLVAILFGIPGHNHIAAPSVEVADDTHGLHLGGGNALSGKVDAHTCTPTLQRIQQILCVNGFGGVGDIAKEGHLDAFLHIYLLLGGAKLMNIF